MIKKYFLLIVLIGAIFRFSFLTSSPPSLNWDEVSIGYNAYSILKTARDEWGNFIPLTFTAFGENKLPGMIYLSVPSIAIFGLTDFAVRFTPALFGTLSILALFLLAKEIFKSGKLALFSALLLAISPWHIHFSRVAFEATPALFFFLLGTYFLLKAIKSSSLREYLLTTLFYLISLYTYNSMRIFIPLFLLTLLLTKVIKLTAKSRKPILISLVIGIFCTLPIVLELSSSEGRVRLGALSINSQKSFIDDIASSRGYTTLPNLLPRLIHNKATHYTFKLAHNYLKTFSTEFLIFQGEANTQRSVQGMGLLYLFELPLLIIGLFSLSKRSKKIKSIIIPILLLSPIPSAITTDAPSSVRALTMLPALLMIESLGLEQVINSLRGKSRYLKFTFALFAVWSVSYFAYQLFLVYPVKYADDWQYGYKQAMSYAYDHYDEVDRIYFTSKYGEPHIYALFYGQFDPATYHQLDVKYSVDPLGWIHVESFDKFTFTQFTGLQTPDEIVARTTGKSLLVTGFANLPSTMPREFELKAPNWKVMFEGVIVDGIE